jgi:two-component system sensor histidine kinase DesK
MQGIPIEIKLTYIIAFVVLLLFLVFIVAVVLIYSKRQKYFLLQQESEDVKHQNELFAKRTRKTTSPPIRTRPHQQRHARRPRQRPQ